MPPDSTTREGGYEDMPEVGPVHFLGLKEEPDLIAINHPGDTPPDHQGHTPPSPDKAKEKQDVAALKEDISSLKSNIHVIDTNLGALVSEVDYVHESLRATHREISDLTQAVNGLRTNPTGPATAQPGPLPESVPRTGFQFAFRPARKNDSDKSESAAPGPRVQATQPERSENQDSTSTGPMNAYTVSAADNRRLPQSKMQIYSRFTPQSAHSLRTNEDPSLVSVLQDGDEEDTARILADRKIAVPSRRARRENHILLANSLQMDDYSNAMSGPQAEEETGRVLADVKIARASRAALAAEARTLGYVKPRPIPSDSPKIPSGIRGGERLARARLSGIRRAFEERLNNTPSVRGEMARPANQIKSTSTSTRCNTTHTGRANHATKSRIDREEVYLNYLSENAVKSILMVLCGVLLGMILFLLATRPGSLLKVLL